MFHNIKFLQDVNQKIDYIYYKKLTEFGTWDKLNTDHFKCILLSD